MKNILLAKEMPLYSKNTIILNKEFRMRDSLFHMDFCNRIIKRYLEFSGYEELLANMVFLNIRRNPVTCHDKSGSITQKHTAAIIHRYIIVERNINQGILTNYRNTVNKKKTWDVRLNKIQIQKTGKRVQDKKTVYEKIIDKKRQNEKAIYEKQRIIWALENTKLFQEDTVNYVTEEKSQYQNRPAFYVTENFPEFFIMQKYYHLTAEENYAANTILRKEQDSISLNKYNRINAVIRYNRVGSLLQNRMLNYLSKQEIITWGASQNKMQIQKMDERVQDGKAENKKEREVTTVYKKIQAEVTVYRKIANEKMQNKAGLNHQAFYWHAVTFLKSIFENQLIAQVFEKIKLLQKATVNSVTEEKNQYQNRPAFHVTENSPEFLIMQKYYRLTAGKNYAANTILRKEQDSISINQYKRINAVTRYNRAVSLLQNHMLGYLSKQEIITWDASQNKMQNKVMLNHQAFYRHAAAFLKSIFENQLITQVFKKIKLFQEDTVNSVTEENNQYQNRAVFHVTETSPEFLVMQKYYRLTAGKNYAAKAVRRRLRDLPDSIIQERIVREKNINQSFLTKYANTILRKEQDSIFLNKHNRINAVIRYNRAGSLLQNRMLNYLLKLEMITWDVSQNKMQNKAGLPHQTFYRHAAAFLKSIFENQLITQVFEKIKLFQEDTVNSVTEEKNQYQNRPVFHVTENSPEFLIMQKYYRLTAGGNYAAKAIQQGQRVLSDTIIQEHIVKEKNINQDLLTKYANTILRKEQDSIFLNKHNRINAVTHYNRAGSLLQNRMLNCLSKQEIITWDVSQNKMQNKAGLPHQTFYQHVSAFLKSIFEKQLIISVLKKMKLSQEDTVNSVTEENNQYQNRPVFHVTENSLKFFIIQKYYRFTAGGNYAAKAVRRRLGDLPDSIIQERILREKNINQSFLKKYTNTILRKEQDSISINKYNRINAVIRYNRAGSLLQNRMLNYLIKPEMIIWDASLNKMQNKAGLPHQTFYRHAAAFLKSIYENQLITQVLKRIRLFPKDSVNYVTEEKSHYKDKILKSIVGYKNRHQSRFIFHVNEQKKQTQAGSIAELYKADWHNRAGGLLQERMLNYLSETEKRIWEDLAVVRQKSIDGERLLKVLEKKIKQQEEQIRELKIIYKEFYRVAEREKTTRVQKEKYLEVFNNDLKLERMRYGIL